VHQVGSIYEIIVSVFKPFLPVLLSLHFKTKLLQWCLPTWGYRIKQCYVVKLRFYCCISHFDNWQL